MEVVKIGDPKHFISDLSDVDRSVVDGLASRIIDGKLVIFSTETVFGLGANALDSDAVNLIYKAKNRPVTNPCIVHVNSIEMAKSLINLSTNEEKVFDQLTEVFWPGPLSLVVTAKDHVPTEVMGGGSEIAIRYSSSPTLNVLIEASGHPIAAPSANKFGRISPTRLDHIYKSFNEDDVVVIDDGITPDIGIESTIIRLHETKISESTYINRANINRADINRADINSADINSANNFKPTGTVMIEILRPGYITSGNVRDVFIQKTSDTNVHDSKEVLDVGADGTGTDTSLKRTLDIQEPFSKRIRWSMHQDKHIDGEDNTERDIDIVIISTNEVHDFINGSKGASKLSNAISVDQDIEIAKQALENKGVSCPGVALTHYAPNVPLILLQEKRISESESEKYEYIIKSEGLPTLQEGVLLVLTDMNTDNLKPLDSITAPSYVPKALMSDIFNLLHKSDDRATQLGAKYIYVLVSNNIHEESEHLALFDRLRRACSGRMCDLVISDTFRGIVNKD